MKMNRETQRIMKRVERNLSAVARQSVNTQWLMTTPKTHGSGAPSRKMVRQCSHPGGFLEPRLNGIPSRKILIGAPRVWVCGHWVNLSHSPCNTYESPGFDQPSHDTLTCPSLKAEGKSASHYKRNKSSARSFICGEQFQRNRQTYFPVDIIPRTPGVRASDSFRLV